MVGDCEVGSYLVELGGDAAGQGVVLCVNCAGAQSGVELGEGKRSGVGAQSGAQILPCFGAGHAQQQAFHIGIAVYFLGAGVDDASTQIHCAQGYQVGVLGYLSPDLLANFGFIQNRSHVLIGLPEIAGVYHGAPFQAGWVARVGKEM